MFKNIFIYIILFLNFSIFGSASNSSEFKYTSSWDVKEKKFNYLVFKDNNYTYVSIENLDNYIKQFSFKIKTYNYSNIPEKKGLLCNTSNIDKIKFIDQFTFIIEKYEKTVAKFSTFKYDCLLISIENIIFFPSYYYLEKIKYLQTISRINNKKLIKKNKCSDIAFSKGNNDIFASRSFFIECMKKN